MTKSIEQFEAEMNAAVDPWVTTMKSSTELMAIMLKPVVEQFEASEHSPEDRNAVYTRLSAKLEAVETDLDGLFGDD